MTRGRTIPLSARLRVILFPLAASVALMAEEPAPLPLSCIWTGVYRVVAVGDVHGDYDQFVRVLRAADVMNVSNAWTGGTTHLVQTGDMLDRGPDSRKVIDLLVELAPQARQAGGGVHALIGNHEAMVMKGDLRYVHPGEFAAFGGKDAFIEAFSPRGKYGRWILSLNTVIQINDTLFLHGGLSPAYAHVPLKTINDRTRRALADPDSRDPIFNDPLGPLWYRGLAEDDAAEVERQVRHVLESKGARRMVVGHTVSREGICSRADGRVILIDVGLSRCYGGPAACLLIEGNDFYVVEPGRRVRLHTASGDGIPAGGCLPHRRRRPSRRGALACSGRPLTSRSGRMRGSRNMVLGRRAALDSRVLGPLIRPTVRPHGPEQIPPVPADRSLPPAPR